MPADRIVGLLARRAGLDRARAAACDGYVLFFGTLEPRKNVGGLLDAYERLARAAQAMSPGSCSPARRPRRRGHGSNGSRGRRSLGCVQAHRLRRSRATGRRLYEGARLLVQPSFEEGFGIPVLEAMTLGVPVVATDRGALPEVTADAGPVVSADNPDELAAAIERLLDDRAFAARVPTAGSRAPAVSVGPDGASRVRDV